MRMSLLAMIGTAAVTACAARAAGPPPTELLRRHTQALVDAVSAGDAAVWDRYLDPSARYLAEDGTVHTKASLLAEIRPLPKGMTGRIAIARFEVVGHGDVAVAIYDLDERGDYFGHPLAAVYRTTDTWRRGPHGWRLIATAVHAVHRDPPAIALPAARLDEYVGTYRLPSAEYTIRREGAGLVGQRAGRPAQPLLVEAPDVLFVAGQPRVRKVFVRDPDGGGRVTGFADRREGRDIVWRRAP